MAEVVKKEGKKEPAKKQELPKYVIRSSHFAFSVPLIGEDGKQIPELDGNGSQKYVYGKKQYISQTHRFTTLVKHPEKGLSVYQVTEDTPPEVCARLADLAADPDAEPRVMLEVEHIKRTNAAQYAEMMKREQLEEAYAKKSVALDEIMAAASGVTPTSPDSIKQLLQKIKEIGN